MYGAAHYCTLVRDLCAILVLNELHSSRNGSLLRVDVLLVNVRLLLLCARQRLLRGAAASEQQASEKGALAHRHTQQPTRPAEFALGVRRVANAALRAISKRCTV